MLRVSTSTLFRTGTESIGARQRDMLLAQQRMSSGKRINVPSDDPLGAADASGIRTNLSQLSSFKSNQDHATYLLNLADSTIGDSYTALQDAQEKLVAAGNGAFGDTERASLATDLQGILGRLVGLANSGDGAGGYLFAGSHENTVPFSQTGNNVSFNGDQILQSVEVSSNRYQQVKFSGDSIFQKIRPGNGTFTTAATGSNTGTGTIDTGSVANPAALTGRPYTITFALAAGVTSYSVDRSDLGGGTTQVASGTYTTPQAISFDGVSVNVAGAPASGDTFTVAPSGFQSVFDTLAQAIATLRTPVQGNPAGNAKFQTALGQAQASLAQALDNFSTSRSEVGSGLQELDAYSQLTGDRQLQYQTRLSAVEDLDMVKGAIDQQQAQTTYQAALQSYTAVSRLSLFNYL